MPGMQKSGTSWFCNMVVDLVGEYRGSNTRDVRDACELTELLAPYYTPTFRKKFTQRRVDTLLDVSRREATTLVFKTHRPPIAYLEGLVSSGTVGATCIFRDPRNIVMSAMEHGRREREAGKWPIRGFARIRSFSQAIRWYKKNVYPVWQHWSKVEGIAMVHYEDLVANPTEVMLQTMEALGVDTSPRSIEDVVSKYDSKKLRNESIRNALHLSVGGAERHKKVFSDSEKAMLEDELSDILRLTGYGP